MYQTIVLGLGFLLVIGGGYLIKSVDKEGVIASSALKEQNVINTQLTGDDMSGIFSCDETSGCDNVHTITFDPSGAVRIVTIYKDGTETLDEQGSWKFENGGFISILITDSQVKHYEIGRAFLIQSVSTSTLGKISYDTNLYPDMHKPTFTKQGE